jgi:hypothetical protein
LFVNLSGDLLLAEPDQEVNSLLSRFAMSNQPFWIIGEMTDQGMIVVK